MTYEEVISHYKTVYRLCKTVGFSFATPRHWRKLGYIPAASQVRIELHCKGALKCRPEDTLKKENHV
jgi:hypothetical protein